MSETDEMAEMAEDAWQPGETVRHKISGQVGTVYESWPGSRTVSVAYEDGTTARLAQHASFEYAGDGRG